MKFNLANRVRQIILGKDQALRPIYEAVANAFDAIREAKNPAGVVTVKVLRDAAPKQKTISDEYRLLAPVIGFEIQDNGVGFTDENFESFDDVYTDRKLSSGGKGTGRLLFAKAFDNAEVLSVFITRDGKFAKRKFLFDDTNGIHSHTNGDSVESKKIGTTVRLAKMRSEYRCPLNATTIARHLIDHHLEELLASELVNFYLVDEDNDEQIDLRDVFKQDFRVDKKSEQVTIKGHKFRVRHFLVRAGRSIEQHRISYCARFRTATEDNASKFLPDLKEPLERDGEMVYYLGTVSSDYLDTHVNETRNGLQIPEESTLADEITRKHIGDAVAKRAKQFLQSDLDLLKGRKKAMVDNVIKKNAPELRTVVERYPDLLDRVSIDSTEQEVLTVVSGQRYASRKDYLALQAEVLKTARAGDRLEAYKKTQLATFTAESKFQASVSLVEFVLHRRAVLDVLNELLGSDDNDKYHREEAVHQLIFPLRQTSDSIPPDIANLWVLDERLAFHHYLASDRRMDRTEPIAVESGREPDIIVFDRACATSDEPENPQTITIIEFKRPGRDDFTFDDNPDTQLTRYINLILDGKAKDRKGRVLSARPETRFFGYIVADFLPSLTKTLDRAGFKPAAEPGTLFKIEPNLKLYAVAIDYKQLITDAARRNRAFFYSLGIH